MTAKVIQLRRTTAVTPPTDYRQICQCGHTALRHDDGNGRGLAGACHNSECSCSEFDLLVKM